MAPTPIEMNRADIVTELRQLVLPRMHFVVVGGAAMTLRDLRETDDIDLVVSRELFQSLEREGWAPGARPDGKPALGRGHVEACLDLSCGEFERTSEWLRTHADTLHGLPVVDLLTLVACKSARGQPKDVADVALIRARHPSLVAKLDANRT
ncbi:MAG: hypothetical protein IT361_02595 [Gemmatimonadaceae bacterium]|nr:hypothetical protein [Gemmatimonadaceae bacterium]